MRRRRSDTSFATPRRIRPRKLRSGTSWPMRSNARWRRSTSANARCCGCGTASASIASSRARRSGGGCRSRANGSARSRRRRSRRYGPRATTLRDMTLLLSLVVVLLVGGALLWLATVAMATPTVAYRIDCRFDVRSTEFLHALSSVLPVTIMHGNRIERLDNGARFYPEMLAAVAAAQRSIALECYIFDRGSIGDAFIAAVCERARAGVRVR